MSVEKLPDIDRESPLNSILSRRKSVRSFLPKKLLSEQTSKLLWACQGITQQNRRTAPSAGALYPLEIFWIDARMAAHYDAVTHSLRMLSNTDIRSDLARAALSQDFIGLAPATIVITAVYKRVTGKYGKARGSRYVDMEAGHAAQNVLLQAAAEGLGSVPVGAFNDEQVIDLLNLPSGHTPLYLIPIGYTTT
jgi:SagB-type dehydrogenase family enzyme